MIANIKKRKYHQSVTDGFVLSMMTMRMILIFILISADDIFSGVLGVAVHTLLEGSGEYSYVASSFETERSYSFLKVSDDHHHANGDFNDPDDYDDDDHHLLSFRTGSPLGFL